MSDRAIARRPSMARLLEILLDGELLSWDAPAGGPPRYADSPDYRRALERARVRSGSDEAVITGLGHLAGRPVAVIASNYAFLTGSVGATAGNRVIAAVERATAERLPVLGIAASAGTRMQEGTPAFVRMAGIASVIAEHQRAGLAYVTYLRHPTLGGVLASWGSLGQVTLAEPGALIGFLGPKVYAALHGEEFPSGIQTAEHLFEHGLVDAVVPPDRLRPALIRVFGLMLDSPTAQAAESPAPESESPAAARQVPDPLMPAPLPAPTAWESVTATRDPVRPGLRELLACASDAFTLADAGPASPASGALLALARFGGWPCVVTGHDRSAPADHPGGPASLRLAQRAGRLAASLRLPLVTVIDTPGSELSARAEEDGTSREIATCLAVMATLEVPTLSVLLGQGGGGAALALLPTDRAIAASHSWLTPLPPEGASVILHSTVTRAAEVSEQQRIRARDLFDLGLVDVLIDEKPDAANAPGPFLGSMTAAIEDQLRALSAEPAGQRHARRRGRWRALSDDLEPVERAT
ncbi:MAG TPA: carboxyl transferase domain-containing protein [Trebonia sp.]